MKEKEFKNLSNLIRINNALNILTAIDSKSLSLANKKHINLVVAGLYNLSTNIRKKINLEKE